MADVELHAARPRVEHHVLHPALVVARRIRERAERVGQHVARPQLLHHLFVARRRKVDVAHQRHADFVRGLQRNVQRRRAMNAARAAPDPHLDADHDVAVRVGDLHGFDRRHQPHLLALADHDGLGEREDAGERDMQIGEDAHLAALDHVLAEAREVARPGAAGVDRGGDAAGAAELLRVDAERRAAPIDMRVQVDQARRDDVALHVARLRRAGQVVADLGDLAAGKRHVGDAVDVLRRVDDARAFKDQIVGHVVSRK